jgi:PAS domain S-box-containing protein
VSDLTTGSRNDGTDLGTGNLFAQLVEQAPFGIYIVDSEFRLQQINRFAAPVFDSVHPLLGRDFAEVITDLLGPDRGSQVAQIFRRTLETGKKYVSPGFTELRYKLGVLEAYEWEVQRITADDGRQSVVCYFHDVTKRRQMAEEITILSAQLSEADCRMDEFLATLAHELRNPLAPICNAIQVMKLSNTLADGVPELVEVLERQTSRLTRLVDDLLDPARVSRGGHGKGSHFEVEHPVLDDGIVDDAIATEVGSGVSLPCRKILVVDDTRVARVTLQRLLSAMGQNVRSVESGPLALEAAIHDPPDIIISDIGMPGMDGYELARQIRAKPQLKDMMLVALTGYGQLRDQEHAKKAGFDWHLTKPANFDDLRKLLLRQVV